MKSFSTHITEAKGGFKDFQDPWAMMNPEDRREAGRLQIAALKAFPGSPRQKDIRAKLNAILKKYRIGEGIEESASDERWMRSVDSFLASVKLGEPYPKHDVVKGKDVHFIVIDTGSVRVTHGGLQSIAVETGEMVAVGQAVGTAGPVTYIGVRRGDWYVDPLSCGVRRTRLVAEGDRDPHR